MEMQIQTVPPYTIAYIRKFGHYGVDNLQTMQKLKDWAQAQGLFREPSTLLAIVQDNPETTPPENCRYDAGIVIPDGYIVSGDAVQKAKIPGGKYAIFKVAHTMEGVLTGYEESFTHLLAKGYHLDDTRPVMEQYTSQMVKDDFCQLCVPIH